MESGLPKFDCVGNTGTFWFVPKSPGLLKPNDGGAEEELVKGVFCLSEGEKPPNAPIGRGALLDLFDKLKLKADEELDMSADQVWWCDAGVIYSSCFLRSSVTEI